MDETFEICRFGKLIENLERNSGVDYRIGDHIHLYIERKLPFLLVHRTREGYSDPVIENIIRNEASFFICPEKLFPTYRLMVMRVVQLFSDEFGAFLLMEIWPDEGTDLSDSHKACFELYGPADYLPRSIETLKENVRKMDLSGLAPEITLSVTDKRCPGHLGPLLSKRELFFWE